MARLTLASLAQTNRQEWWDQAFVDWVAAHEPVDASVAGFEVVTDASLARIRWRAFGAPDTVLARAEDWFEHLGLSGEEGRLASVARLLSANTAGSWIDVSADDLLSGWDLDGPFDLGAVLATLPASESLRRLGAWGEQSGVTSVVRAGMLAGSEGNVELTVSLPGDDIDEQGAAALGLFAALQVEDVPEGMFGILLELGSPALAARVLLTAGGVAGLGVLTPAPPTELVVLECDEVDADPQEVAAFEGTIGKRQRTWLEVAQGHVPTVSLHYRLL